MPDDGFARFDLAVFAVEAHAHLLGAGAAQSELLGEVSAQRARDEEQGLAVLDRRLELAVRTREHRRLPRRQLIGFEPACEQHCAPALAAQLALELARSERRDRAERPQSQKVEALHLLVVERELAGGERGEERARVVDLPQATWSRACCCESSRERSGCEAETRLAPDGGAQASPCLSNRCGR